MQQVIPEQSFFDDPAIDRVMAVTLALAAEVFVLRSRMRDLESALTQAGVPIPSGGDPDADGFVAHLLEATLGERQVGGNP
jgi:hypothetical protein